MLFSCNCSLHNGNIMQIPDESFDWNDIPLLMALGSERRMRAAARRLGVDVSTVSRRLGAIERQLGVKLFFRDAEGYKPTDAGAALLEGGEAMRSQLRGLLAQARHAADDSAGPVRLTSVDVLLDDWLVPRLPQLIESHPGLDLQLIPDSHNLSFTRSEADLALRLARPREDAALLMRRIGHVSMAVYGAPRFRNVARERWAAQPWIALGSPLEHVPEMQWLRRQLPQVRLQLQSPSAASLVQACEAGIGLALLPAFCARGRRLVCLGQGPELRREVWLLSHRDTAKVRRFRLVADWLAARMKADRDLLEGA